MTGEEMAGQKLRNGNRKVYMVYVTPAISLLAFFHRKIINVKQKQDSNNQI